MREFVLSSGKGANTVSNAVKPSQGVAPTPTRKRNPGTYSTPAIQRQPVLPSAPRATAGKPNNKVGQRCFVVAYKGSFIGFFEAQTTLKPHEAFLRVAADMAARDESFVPARLELFKPVLIKSARPPEDENLFRGKLRCVRSRKKR